MEIGRMRSSCPPWRVPLRAVDAPSTDEVPCGWCHVGDPGADARCRAVPVLADVTVGVPIGSVIILRFRVRHNEAEFCTGQAIDKPADLGDHTPSHEICASDDDDPV